MRTQKTREVVKQAEISIKKKGGKEKGYCYFQQEDGTTRKLPFVDAKGDVELTCLQSDIDNAICGDHMNCVQAFMFRRTFGALCTEVRVGKSYVWVVQGTGDRAFCIRFGFKGMLKKAIHSYDVSRGHHGFVVGGKYVLTIPSEQSKRNARPGRWKGHQKNTDGSGQDRAKSLATIKPTRNVMCFLPLKKAV